ncbi:hypothetical protein Tco_0743062 [Tanacetum coccineum]
MKKAFKDMLHELGGKLIQLMYTTMVPEQVKTKKIQAGVQVSRLEDKDGTDIQKESQKQTKPSKGWQRPSQAKAKNSHMKKIQLEGLKLPNLKLYYKSKRQGSKLQTGKSLKQSYKK